MCYCSFSLRTKGLVTLVAHMKHVLHCVVCEVGYWKKLLIQRRSYAGKLSILGQKSNYLATQSLGFAQQPY